MTGNLNEARRGSASLITRASLAKLGGMPGSGEIWITDSDGTPDTRVVLTDPTEINDFMDADSGLVCVIYGPGIYAPHRYASQGLINLFFAPGASVAGNAYFEDLDITGTLVISACLAFIKDLDLAVGTVDPGTDTYGLLAINGSYVFCDTPKFDTAADSGADHYNVVSSSNAVVVLFQPLVLHGNIEHSGAGANSIAGGFLISPSQMIGETVVAGVGVQNVAQISADVAGPLNVNGNMAYAASGTVYDVAATMLALCTAASISPVTL